jgi:hypothetical protein
MPSDSGDAGAAANPSAPTRSSATAVPAGLGAEDASLGGYFREHSRPPGFEGLDKQPYTVSLEAEQAPSLSTPYEGYLVFPRWAETGLGVVGHLETSTLLGGTSAQDVLDRLGEIPLRRVKELLDEAILKSAEDSGL